MNDNRNTVYAETLSSLIQMETVSVVGQTDLTAFYNFHNKLKETFPHVFSAVTVEEFDGSLLMRWAGKNSKKAPILLMSHHDVVEAAGKWTHEPFSGDIAEGKIWGRGTLDTKGNLWAMLQAADELAAEGFVPDRDTYFVTACNEETTGHGGDTISRTLQERGLRFYMVLDEGGMIMDAPIAGVKGTFAMIGVGEKGSTDLKFIARSSGGHASAPEKNTPLVRLGKFMAAAESSNCFQIKMSATVEEMIRRLSVGMPGPMKAAVGQIGKLKGIVAPVLPALSPSAGAMVKTTLAFTMSSGSEGRNVLPQEAWVIGNMRFSHHQGQEKSVAAIRKLAAKYKIETQVLEAGFESPMTDYNGEPFKLVERAVEAIFPGVHPAPYVMNGASDSRFFSRVSDHCIRFAPFLISNKQLDSIHGLDENVDVSTLAGAVDFFKYILKEN